MSWARSTAWQNCVRRARGKERNSAAWRWNSAPFATMLRPRVTERDGKNTSRRNNGRMKKKKTRNSFLARVCASWTEHVCERVPIRNGFCWKPTNAICRMAITIQPNRSRRSNKTKRENFSSSFCIPRVSNLRNEEEEEEELWAKCKGRATRGYSLTSATIKIKQKPRPPRTLHVVVSTFVRNFDLFFLFSFVGAFARPSLF